MTEIDDKISELTACNIKISEELEILKNNLYASKKKIKALEETKKLLEE